MATASPTVENLLRLAWEAEAEGRPRLRDALLTLVVAESGPDDAVLAERCRRCLVARQPDHWFATGATLGQILAHPRVAGALTKLRSMFPPVRVQRLLLRFDAQRGAFTGGRPPLTTILQDLHLVPSTRPSDPVAPALPRARDHAPEPAPERSSTELQALPFPVKPGPAGGGPTTDPDGALSALYLTVLLAMAVLLQGVLQQEPSARDSRAA